MTELGLMQGRLLPRYLNRYQAHPFGYWPAEFFMAKQFGFSAIEFIVDMDGIGANPLMTLDGVASIRSVCEASGVGVRSICADFLMEIPLHSSHQGLAEQWLSRLIEHAASLGITDIIIPCVDQSRLQDDHDQRCLVQSLDRLLPLAVTHGVILNLETDLSPARFLYLLSQVPHSHVAVNYDSGNSASLGFDPDDEFAAYGDRVSVVHIKDRVLNGGSVPLGTGDARLASVFDFLKSSERVHTITMQAYRYASYGDDFLGVINQLAFIREYLIR